jgi:hypothetical protein
MEKELILQICKDETLHLIDKHHLSIRNIEVDDIIYCAFSTCIKHDYTDEKYIKYVVFKTIFYNA